MQLELEAKKIHSNFSCYASVCVVPPRYKFLIYERKFQMSWGNFLFWHTFSSCLLLQRYLPLDLQAWDRTQQQHSTFTWMIQDHITKYSWTTKTEMIWDTKPKVHVVYVPLSTHMKHLWYTRLIYTVKKLEVPRQNVLVRTWNLNLKKSYLWQ